jgi:hypothetical protein
VPVVAGEFVVGAGEEVVALGIVLADEKDEGWLGAAGEAADPPSSLSPGGKPTKHPKAGRRPVALRDETHRTKQMEGNTRREIGVPSASVPYSRRRLDAARPLHQRRGRRSRSGGRPGARSGAIAGRTSAARERHTSRTPRVQLAWGSNTLVAMARGFRSSSKAEADDLAPLGRPNLHGRVIFQAAVEERALRMHAWQEGALLVDNS